MSSFENDLPVLVVNGETLEGGKCFEARNKYCMIQGAYDKDKIYIWSVWSKKNGSMRMLIDYIVNKLQKKRLVFCNVLSEKLITKLKNVKHVDFDEKFGLLVEIKWA